MNRMNRNHDEDPTTAQAGQSRHQVHAQERRALRRLSMSVKVAIGAAIVMAMVSGTLGVALVSLASSSTNSSNVRALQEQNRLLTKQLAVSEQQVRATCRFYLDLARSQSALNGRSQPLAFSIIADAFNAYTGLGCRPTYGPLPKPDPRIVKYIPSGSR